MTETPDGAGNPDATGTPPGTPSGAAKPDATDTPATTETPAAGSPVVSPRRILVGGLIGLVSHALSVLAGYVAGRVSHPSAGNEFADLAAVASALLLTEIVVGVACLIVGGVLVVRGRRDFGLGLVGGWLLGLLLGCLVLTL